MRKIFVVVVLGITCVLFFGCKRENKDILKKIALISTDSVFTFNDLKESSWDRAYLVLPYGYSSLERENLSIPIFTEREIKSKSENEGYCSLLFIKNQKLVDYVVIPRTNVDFDFAEENENGRILILPGDKLIVKGDKPNRVISRADS